MDHLICGLHSRFLSFRRVLGQGWGERDGVSRTFHFGFEVCEEHVAILVDAVAPISGDKYVAVPTVSGLATCVLPEDVGHVGGVPVDVTLGPRHVERVDDLEADLFGSLVCVVDTGFLPLEVTLAVWGHPVHGESINANRLGGEHVLFPLLMVVSP